MYLSRLYLKNYRSIRELDIQFSKGKNVVIGRNNAGKSNIVRAIDLLLGESMPTYHKSENITENDFFSCKERCDEGCEVAKSADELYIWGEITRDQNEPLNYDELYNCSGYFVYSESGQKTPRRFPQSMYPQDINKLFEITEDVLVKGQKKYIDPKKRAEEVLEYELEDKYYFAYVLRANKEADGTISKHIRFLYRENKNCDWVLAFRATIRTELLQSAMIHSFRDPQSQLRLSNWTWYGKLMRHLTEGHEKSSKLQAAFKEVQKVADDIFQEIKKEVSSSSLQVAFPNTELLFQFHSDTGTEIHKNCVIYIDDGFKSPLLDKGSGIQSATIIGLFTYYTNVVNARTSALLCIEEPELYLHPHARRVISNRLDDFIGNNRNQVILTTHSVEFIRTVNQDMNLILVAKGNWKDGSKAKTIQTKQFKQLLLNNNQNELFFADKVVLCEGYDEYVLRAIAEEFFPGKLDEQNVSIISVEGKDNFKQLAKLILDLEKKCFLMADFDYLLRDKLEDRKKYGKDVKAHESLDDLPSKFFEQECSYGNKGARIKTEISELRRLLKEENEQAFYTSKSSKDFNLPKLQEHLNDLRINGVCLLSGDIESLCKQSSFLSAEKKLTLDKVYELNRKLAEGEKIIDIFETSEIEEFLRAVFLDNTKQRQSSP